MSGPVTDRKIAQAVDEQVSLNRVHLERVRQKRDRYDRRSIAHAAAAMEVTMHEEIQAILLALSVGKTVSPS